VEEFEDSMRKSLVLFSLVVMLGLTAGAQKSEIGFVVGGKMTPDGTSPTGTTKVDTALAFQVNFATQLISFKVADLELNIPLLAVPTSEISSSTLFTAKSYSSLYITPGLRFRLGTTVSPFVEAGVGIVRHGPSSTTLGGFPSGANSSTKGAFDVGGGIDFRPKKSPIAFRFQATELYSGVPDLAIPKLSMHNNVLLGGGIVLRF
jgi:opacity protein-like surface antigen